MEIICYGDSNTYGYNPDGLSERYSEEERWVERMQAILGTAYVVHNEGLNGRTTDVDDIFDEERNGAKYLPATLKKYPDADLLILMLGTNDLKSYFRRGAEEIADAVAVLIAIAKQIMKKEAKILLVSPILVGEAMGSSPFSVEFGAERSRKESQKFANLYRRKAKENETAFLDAAKYAEVSQGDSLHLTAEGHAALAVAIAEKVLKIRES